MRVLSPGRSNHNRVLLVISREALAKIEAGNGPLGLKQIAAVRGFNYSKGKWADIVALGRDLP